MITTSLANALAVAAVAQGTASSTPLVTGAVDVSRFDQILMIVRLGDMAAETIDGGLQSVDSDGTSNAANITTKQFTQLAAYASNNDNKILVMAAKGVDLLASGKRHVRGRMVTGNTTGGTVNITILGLPKYGPPSDFDSSDVVQIVP